MDFRTAVPADLDEICRITDQAKAQLKSLGLDQWQYGYPSRAVWSEDIQREAAWLSVEGAQILGAFAFQTLPDASYAVIDGSWRTAGPYASMHRVCVADGSKGRGVAGQMFAHGFAMARALGFPALRIDTHPGNLPMQRALQKAGFLLCGTIHLAGGCEAGHARLAFERLV